MHGATSSSTGTSIQGMRINSLRLADDIILLEENPEDLAETTNGLRTDCKLYEDAKSVENKENGIWGEKHRRDIEREWGEDTNC